MATGPGVPGPQSAYIPNWDASGRLGVGYSRNVKKFPWLKAIQMVESKKPSGYYLKLMNQEAARAVQRQDNAWNWGNPRPMHTESGEQMKFVSFLTARMDYGFALDDDTERVADWDIGEQYAKMYAAQAMTNREVEINRLVTTASEFQTSADEDMSTNHTSTASALVGGYLDSSTTTTLYIKKFINRAQATIKLDTLGVVQPDQMYMMMNDHTAYLLSESAELHDYIKGSPDALDEIRTGNSPNAGYGLPSKLYGMDVIVNDTVKVTNRKGATLAKSFSFPDQTILIGSRPGELEGVYGMPSFSTFTWFWYRDEMTLERFQDAKNRMMDYHLVDCGVMVMTSPLSGYLLTAATSVAS